MSAALLMLVVGCHGKPRALFAEQVEARRLAADLRIQFITSANASDRAVMADTDEESVDFAREAEQTSRVVENDLSLVQPLLESLGYPDEIRLADEFARHFSEYRALDRAVLGLAVENTNLKAQRLSFGPELKAADAFRDALQSLNAPAKVPCGLKPLVEKAILAVREIEVLQGPHIAEADDAAMTRMEAEMNSRRVDAEDALRQLSAIVDPKEQAQLDVATRSFAEFSDLSKQVLTLSRRNSNVRSLSLALRNKPALESACEASLRELDDTLSKERFTAATR